MLIFWFVPEVLRCNQIFVSLHLFIVIAYILTDIYTFSAYLMDKFHCRKTYAYKNGYNCPTLFSFFCMRCVVFLVVQYVRIYLSFIDLALPFFYYLLIVCCKFQQTHSWYQLVSSFTLVIWWLILFQSYDFNPNYILHKRRKSDSFVFHHNCVADGVLCIIGSTHSHTWNSMQDSYSYWGRLFLISKVLAWASSAF
jgi:hypothetical protein